MKQKNKLHFYINEVLIIAAIALCLFVLNAVTIIYTDISPVITTAFYVAFFLIVTVVFILIKRFVSKKKTDPLPDSTRVLADAVLNIPFPSVICLRGEDVIVWYNKKAAELFGKKRIPFSELFQEVRNAETSDEVIYSAGGALYKPMTFEENYGDSDYLVYIFDDVTYAENINRDLHGASAAVAFVTVDNLDEMLDYEQEDYRAASGSVESILRSFAIEHNGFIKEYKQDRYILLFSRSNIQKFKEEGFTVLDKIHSVLIRGNVPVTISMGISAGGTLEEREHQAQSALETALQRGGDQVVIKADGVTEIFGGKIKTVQNRSTVKTRSIANELVSHIRNASNVIVMAHRYADFDAIGASAGIARIAMHCGKTVNIVSDMDDMENVKCRELLPSKIYDKIFIDTNNALEVLNPESLLVIVDVNNINQFENRELAEKASNIVVIDHHRKFADESLQPLLSYIEPSASAASELIAEMLEYLLDDDELLTEEATLLLSGIYLDTNRFKKDAGTSTFSAALYLRSNGADIGAVQELFKTRLGDFQRELKFTSNVEIYRSVFAISTTDANCTLKDKIPAAKAADSLLNVEGVKASIVLVPIDNFIHVSARSSGDINVQLLLEKVHGGGHFDSAGAVLKDVSVENAVELLKNTIDDYMKEI